MLNLNLAEIFLLPVHVVGTSDLVDISDDLGSLAVFSLLDDVAVAHAFATLVTTLRALRI